MELFTVETPDISEYLYFGWYGRVWYKKDAGLGDTKLVWFLVPSHIFGLLMSFWVLPDSGIRISRTTVQRVIRLETQTDANRKRFEYYATAITEIFHEVYTQESFPAPSSDNPTIEIWEYLANGNEDFQN